MATQTVRPLEDILAAIRDNASRVHGAVIERPDSNFSQLIRDFSAHLEQGGGGTLQNQNNVARYLASNPDVLAQLQQRIGDRPVGFQGAGEHAIALSVTGSNGNTEILRITRANEAPMPQSNDVLRPSATATHGDIRLAVSQPAVSLDEFVQAGVLNRHEAERLNKQHHADLMRTGLHNNDGHLGNTGVTPDGRLVVTDPGAVTTLAAERARIAALPPGSQRTASEQHLQRLEALQGDAPVNAVNQRAAASSDLLRSFEAPTTSEARAPEAPRPTQLGGDSRLGQNTMLGGQPPSPHTPPAGTPPVGTPHGGHPVLSGGAASVAADAAHAAPGIGAALSRVGSRAARLLPIAGVGITAAAAGANAAEATAAYNRGEISGTQLAAVVAGGTANTAGAVGSLVTGTATEEAVAKMQEAAGVPEHLREGTLRQAVTQLGTAVSNAVTPQRVAHTPEQQNFYKFVDGLPERPDPSMSPQLRGIVEANAARLQAERAHSSATQNPQGANVVNARTTLERAEERVDAAYTQIEKSGGLAAVQSEITARQQAQRAVAGLGTQVTRQSTAAEEAPQAPPPTPNEKPQPSVAQARA